MRFRPAALNVALCCALALCACGGSGTTTSHGASGSGGVLQYHGSLSRNGVYVDAAFTRQAAAGLHRDTGFSARLMGPTYAQPLYYDAGGGKDLVIVATEQNQVSAFSADDGSVVWQKVLGRPATSARLPCGNIDPLGVTGTPVIDPATRTLYLDTMTLDGDAPKHMIHALSLDDGSELHGWPVDVNASVRAGSVAFESSVQNQRGGLLLLKGMLYVPYGGHAGDCGNYHGWVVGVPLDKPSEPIGWATRGIAGGVWAPGGIASDGSSLFIATGNTEARPGSFSAPSEYGDGESVIRLPPDLEYTQRDPDFAAAMNWQNLDDRDADVGGSGPVLFSVAGAKPSDLAIALGKDGGAYLLDAKNLGGIGHPLASKHVSSNGIINAAVAYTTAKGTFVAFRGRGIDCPSGVGQITALAISAGAPPAMSLAWCAGPDGSGSPIVTTTDGSSDSIIWYVSAEADNKLYGLDAESGAMVFDGGGSAEAMGNVNRYQTPIAAKGRIYVAGANQLYAFSVR